MSFKGSLAFNLTNTDCKAIDIDFFGKIWVRLIVLVAEQMVDFL
jgi:hypothetical protein